MGRRVKTYIDIVLQEKDVARIKDGYKVGKMVDGQLYSLAMKKQSPMERKIEALESELRALRGQVAKSNGKSTKSESMRVAMKAMWARMTPHERAERVSKIQKARMAHYASRS